MLRHTLRHDPLHCGTGAALRHSASSCMPAGSHWPNQPRSPPADRRRQVARVNLSTWSTRICLVCCRPQTLRHVLGRHIDARASTPAWGLPSRRDGRHMPQPSVRRTRAAARNNAQGGRVDDRHEATCRKRDDIHLQIVLAGRAEPEFLVVRLSKRNAMSKMITGPFRVLMIVVFFGCGLAPSLAQSPVSGRRDATHPAPHPPRRPIESAPAAQPPPAPAPEEAVPDWPTTDHVKLRAHIHSCAVQWRSMKERGADIGTTWADFSQKCMAVE